MREPREDIAIVGMSCLFPGADGLTAYWQNILANRCAFSEPPSDWEGSHSFDPESKESDRIYCRRAGYLGDISRFDPLEYGIMPKGVDASEPEHFLALRVAVEALKDAGYPDIPLRTERTEVILGRGTYVNRALMNLHQQGSIVHEVVEIVSDLRPDLDEAALAELRRRLRSKLPEFDPVAAAGVVSSITSGRIANRLNLQGANYCLDAACASSLIAVEHAIEDLRSGKCDAAIAGGVQLSANHLVFMVFSQLGALSRRAEIRPFDRKADGTLLGEGVGMVVLKRRTDAERDGNRIYSLIKGVGVASDGRAKSIVAPRQEGQVLALRRAYETSGVPPSTVGLIEAHGTGIPLGDATELASLKEVFGPVGAETSCAIGSVKSIIGHLIPAAGIAGLIKTSLAMYHKVLPPTANCDEVNGALGLEGTPFYVNGEARPWIHSTDEAPRRAGVSAFGFGGINAHAVLEEYRCPATAAISLCQPDWPADLFVITAATREALVARVDEIATQIERAPDVGLKDVAYTLNTGEAWGRVRVAAIASSPAELVKKLRHTAQRLRDPECRRIKDRTGLYYFESPLAGTGGVAFVFPGEGSQYSGMLADLCMHFPRVRSCFDDVERAFAEEGRPGRLSRCVFKTGGCTGSADDVWSMDVAVQAVTAANRALYQLVSELGLRPTAVVGHSSGEFGALEAAGVVRQESDAAYRAYLRAGIRSVLGVMRNEEQLPKVQLLAAGGDDAGRLASAIGECNGTLTLAIHNCPFQFVVSVSEEDVPSALRQLQTAGATVVKLPFHRAYHTSQFASACGPLEEFFAGLRMGTPSVPLYSCATAERFPADPSAIREWAVSQWTRPVRFQETIERMYADGARLFVEVGPRSNLSSFVRNILGKQPHEAIALNVERKSGIVQLQHALGLLAAHGVDLNLAGLYRMRSPNRIDIGELESSSIRRRAPRLSLALPTLSLNEEDIAAVGTPRLASVPGTTAAGATGQAAAARAANSNGHSPETSAAGAYLRTMQEFLRVQSVALDAFNSARGGAMAAGASATPGPAHLPFAGEVVEETPGVSIRLSRTLDVDRDLFLRDHELGGRPSLGDPELRALRVMPLTMSLEMIAEAAVRLVPERVVIGLRDVRANHWITVPAGRLALEVAAVARGADRVDVEIRTPTDLGGMPRTYVEATVVLSDRYAAAPEAGARASLEGEKASRFRAGTVYTTGMFNGPAFQALKSVSRWSPEGSVGQFEVLPRNGLFSDTARPEFVLEPVLLDAAGQLAAHWNAEADSSGFNFFPYRCEAIDVFGACPEPGRRYECRLRIGRIAPDTYRCDMELVDETGHVYLRLTGWEDKSFPLPRVFYGILHGRPDDNFSDSLSQVLPAGGAEDEVECRRVGSLRRSLLLQHGGIWLNALAYQVLSRREREKWLSWNVTSERKMAWLLGRTAVKDAVRHLLRRKFRITVQPADIEVENDAAGRPRVTGAWSGEAPGIGVSLAHAGDNAIGIAWTGARAFGVDLELVRPLDAATEQLAFTQEERALLEDVEGTERATQAVRFWAAKEAASKAAGVSRDATVRAFRVTGLASEKGELDVEWWPDWEAPSATARFRVRAGRHDGYVIAVASQVEELAYAGIGQENGGTPAVDRNPRGHDERLGS